MSDKIKPWKGRKPSKKNKSLRIGNERMVPLHANDETDYEEDRFPHNHDDDPDLYDEFPR